MVKADPAHLADSTVTARSANGHAIYDGIWVDGRRSWDTYILIDGVVAYHSPVETVGTATFEVHEAAEGGRTP